MKNKLYLIVLLLINALLVLFIVLSVIDISTETTITIIDEVHNTIQQYIGTEQAAIGQEKLNITKDSSDK